MNDRISCIRYTCGHCSGLARMLRVMLSAIADSSTDCIANVTVIMEILSITVFEMHILSDTGVILLFL